MWFFFFQFTSNYFGNVSYTGSCTGVWAIRLQHGSPTSSDGHRSPAHPDDMAGGWGRAPCRDTARPRTRVPARGRSWPTGRLPDQRRGLRAGRSLAGGPGHSVGALSASARLCLGRCDDTADRTGRGDERVRQMLVGTGTVRPRPSRAGASLRGAACRQPLPPGGRPHGHGVRP